MSEAGPEDAPPPAAGAVFGSRLELAQRYARLLRTDGVARGLLGPREATRLWERHLLNCAVVAELVPRHARVCDVGSGAGLPGIVLAIVRPDLEIVLLDPLLRRVRFLGEAISRLGLSGVTVERGRADGREHGGRGTAAGFDVVTARAVAPLERLAPWCLPMIRPAGALLAIKGAGAATELVAAESALGRLGARSWELCTVGAGLLDPPTTVVRVRAGGEVQPTRRNRRS